MSDAQLCTCGHAASAHIVLVVGRGRGGCSTIVRRSSATTRVDAIMDLTTRCSCRQYTPLANGNERKGA